MKRQKLLLLKGLPASGKTTYAKELEAEGWFRANKDDLRRMIQGGYKQGKEKHIITIERDLVRNRLEMGENVVVDNTHLNPIHEEFYRGLAEGLGVDFEVKFFDVHLEECIRRNLKRQDSIPTEAIVGMYNRYLDDKEEHVEYDDNLDEAIVVDVDGTLAHLGGNPTRGHYAASRAMEDFLDDAVSTTVAMYHRHGYRVIILTGRHSGHLQVTKDWLNANGVDYDEIHCREEGDGRPDYIVKKELFDKHIRGKYNVKFVFDDRPQVIRMWQSLGLKVFNVGRMNVEF